MPPPSSVVDVTAVLVAHDGERWLPQALVALAAQSVQPRRVLAVDTGSEDGTAALLAAATGASVDRVVRASRSAGFGVAVAAALEVESDAYGGPAAWLWLLHDDCAPEPIALAELLEEADATPSAALLGPKVRDWDDPRRLVEVGLTTDAAGRRWTGLERREYDQGQHDAVRDVLAVGTAGALVRRDVWDELGGLDPELPVFRDDLDLGWRVNAAGHRVLVVPRARVRHARAATTGRRALAAARGRPEAVDRRHALLLLLAHASAAALPLAVLRLLVVTAGRVLAAVLSRDLPPAGDELSAAAWVLLHPGRVARARRARSRSRQLPARALRPLFAHRRGTGRARLEGLAERLRGAPAADERLGAPGDRGLATPDEPDPAPRRRPLQQPVVLLVLALVLVALLAERRLLPTGDAVLAGGRLLPTPAGARDLWHAYASSWHAGSVGSAVPAPPGLAVLAALSTVLLGKPWLAVDLLLLASVPLAGATAYAAVRHVVRHEALRLWAAATWALLPVATGAVATGRLDAAALQVGLPLLVLASARLLSRDPREAGWRRAWATGLGLALLTALAPPLHPVAVVLLLGGAVVAVRGPGGARRASAAALAAVLPVALLLPWSLHVLADAALLHGPGPVDPALTDPYAPVWHLLLLSPGGPGMPAVWLGGALLLAALAALLRRSRQALVLGGWALALVGLAGAVVLSRLTPPAPGSGRAAAVWPGTPLQVAAAGLLLAAAVGADGVRTRLGSASFGWRQLGAVVLTALTALVPVVAAASWLLHGADDPLRRSAGAVLPAFAQADLAAAPGSRALLLRPRDGAVAYALTDATGVTLEEVQTPPTAEQRGALDAVVADLLTASGSDAALALATRAVRYVALPAGAPDQLALVLDAQDGLVRRARGEQLLWQVTPSAPHLSLLTPALAAAALSGDRAPSAGALRANPLAALAESDTTLPAGPAGRLVVLSEAADPGWRATLDGQELTRATAWGWAAAFRAPAEGGRLVVTRADQAGRSRSLVLQGLLVGLVAVLAAPVPARRRELEIDPHAGRGRS